MLPIVYPKFVLTLVLIKFVDGNIAVNVSISVAVKTCLSFDFTNSILKSSELESSSGPILKTKCQVIKFNNMVIAIIHFSIIITFL